MNPLGGTLDAAPLAAINHLLEAAPWARARLKPFAGQVAVFEISPLTVQLEVDEEGRVRAPSSDPCGRLNQRSSESGGMFKGIGMFEVPRSHYPLPAARPDARP